jgi:hypothetical protein
MIDVIVSQLTANPRVMSSSWRPVPDRRRVTTQTSPRNDRESPVTSQSYEIAPELSRTAFTGSHIETKADQQPAAISRVNTDKSESLKHSMKAATMLEGGVVIAQGLPELRERHAFCEDEENGDDPSVSQERSQDERRPLTDHRGAYRGSHDQAHNHDKRVTERLSRSQSVSPKSLGPESHVDLGGRSDARNRTAIRENGDSGVRLRVDANTALSLQLNSDIGGSTIQLVPLEDGMVESVFLASPYAQDQGRERAYDAEGEESGSSDEDNSKASANSSPPLTASSQSARGTSLPFERYPPRRRPGTSFYKVPQWTSESMHPSGSAAVQPAIGQRLRRSTGTVRRMMYSGESGFQYSPTLHPPSSLPSHALRESISRPPPREHDPQPSTPLGGDDTSPHRRVALFPALIDSGGESAPHAAVERPPNAAVRGNGLQLTSLYQHQQATSIIDMHEQTGVTSETCTNVATLEDTATDADMVESVGSDSPSESSVHNQGAVDTWLDAGVADNDGTNLEWDYNNSPSGPSSYAASIASVFSVTSLASSASDMSRGSGYSAVQIATATKVLLAIFYDDETLLSLYKRAIEYQTIGPARLQRNLRRLFRVYSGLLEGEATERLEYLASRLVLMESANLAESIVGKLQNGRAGVQLPCKEYNDESSDEEDKSLDTRSVNEDAFEDLVVFREFLVESEAFRTFRVQLQAFVLPKSTHPETASKGDIAEPAKVESVSMKAVAQDEEDFNWQKCRKVDKQSADGFFCGAYGMTPATSVFFLMTDAFMLATDDVMIAAGLLEPPLRPDMVRLRWQCVRIPPKQMLL